MQSIAPFRVMDILAQAQQLDRLGRDVVHMEVGEPDFPAPKPVNEAAREALAAGRTHYTPALGIQPLRETVAAYYGERFGVRVDPQRVVITPGASGALQLILGVLIDPHDEVLLQDPGYPCNRHMIEMYGGRARALPCEPYRFEPERALSALGEAAGMMLATPANPTGEVIPIEVLREVHEGMSAAHRFLIVDEIYQGLQYDSPVRTALELQGEGLFVINSFSKYFGMTGYRIGWAVVPDAYVEPIERLAQNLFLSPPTVAQHAALAAFTPEVMHELQQRRAIFEARRNLLYEGLQSLGFGIPESPPQGAFYVYAGTEDIGWNDAEAFARELLERHAVAVTPGIDFGFRDTANHVRFAYTTDENRIADGLERIARFIGR
jgi:aspartate/methionine/tyrosine aminotransferase